MIKISKIKNQIKKIENYKEKILIFSENYKDKLLIISEYGYPLQGGGECWLVDSASSLYPEYNIYYLYFKKNNKEIENRKIFINQDIVYIEMPYNIINIIDIILEINPNCISHQGSLRRIIQQISNILNIPFITGICFWNDMFGKNFSNIDILEKNYEINKNFYDIVNDSDYIYASSIFVEKVLKKYFNLDLPIINTISKKEHYEFFQKANSQVYVTIINIHTLKGGWLAKYLVKNLSPEIPLLLIYSEKDHTLDINELQKDIDIRNRLSTNIIKTKLVIEKMNAKEIYKNTKIILVPSIVDETFCRVAYESMENRIPIISTTSGNLKYLLKDYAIFCEKYNFKQWEYEILKLYKPSGTDGHDSTDNVAKTITKEYNDFDIFKNMVKEIKIKKKFNLIDENVAIFSVWSDQGLGVQSREYYLELIKKGYNPYIIAFKSYSEQIDKEEWNYKNVIYFNESRENFLLENIIDVIHKFKISKVIIPEICFFKIFEINNLLKRLNVKILAVPNIECVRRDELSQFIDFSRVCTNNIYSSDVLTSLNIPNTHVGFFTHHPYLQNKKIENLLKSKDIKFFCCGGYNSIFRKKIDVIINSFSQLNYKNFYLDVYILCEDIFDSKHIESIPRKNITVHMKKMSYKEVIEKFYNHDIFIHAGNKEGLGLGFFESISTGTPVLTTDGYPNKEIIKENINGWNVTSHKNIITENNQAIVSQYDIDPDKLVEKFHYINFNYNKLEMFNKTIQENEENDSYCHDYMNNIVAKIKILMVGYYGYEDGYYALWKSLADNFGYEISFFPVSEYISRNIENDLTDLLNSAIFSEMPEKLLINYFNNSKTKADYIVFHHNFDMIDNLVKKYNLDITKLKARKVIVNWDPQIEFTNYSTIEKFDKVFVCSPKLVNFNNNNKFKFFRTGYNKIITYPILNEKYKCDVSIIITNLYEKYGNTEYSRKDFIDALIESGINLEIYGTKNLAAVYPKQYKGFIKYKDIALVMTNSKICLNISPVYDINEDLGISYYSERLALIFGSESVMFSNNLYCDLLEPNIDYIYAKTPKDAVMKIKYYLENEDQLNKILENAQNKKHFFEYEYILKKYIVNNL